MWYLNNLSRPINNSSVLCGGISDYLVELDLDNWWYFYKYPNTSEIIPPNLFTIYSVEDINFLVTALSFSIEIDKLDPGVQYFYPFIIPNPYSLVSPINTTFKMYSDNVASNLTYICIVTYHQLSLVCSVDVLYVIPGQWWGNCNCPPASKYLEITPSILVPAIVNLYPVFKPNFYFMTTTADYFIYEQVTITSIVPNSSPPNNLITIYIDGIIGNKIIATIFISDDKSHHWDVYQIDQNFIVFNLTSLSYTGMVKMCMSVTMNNRDFTTTECSQANTLFYQGSPIS